MRRLSRQNNSHIAAAALIALGFIIGCVFTDIVRLSDEVYKRQSSADFGVLLLSYFERPEHCPYCGYEFIYLYKLTDEDIQRIIDNYLDHVPYGSEKNE